MVGKCRAEENIVISEVLINGKEGEEFIELYNPNDNPINLEDYYLNYYPQKNNWDGDGARPSKKFPDKSIIQSKSFYLIVVREQDFPNISIDWNFNYKSNGLLANTKGGSIAIFPNNLFEENNAIDFVAWGNTDFVGDGQELEIPKKDSFQSFERINNSPNHWQLSCDVNGSTPGKENSICEEEKPTEPKNYSSKIKINEIYPSPDTKIETEFIEIKNISDENIDLKNWSASDSIHKGKPLEESYILEPGKFYVFKGKFYFNPSNDSANIFDENKKIVDSISYGKGLSKYTYAFDGSNWKWTSRPTPGEENEFDKTFSNKIISIIGFSPNPKGSDTKNEWIEIQNKSKKKINLKGWSIATGWDKMYNHPIRENFEIKAGKTKRLTRKICAFTLNNQKTRIELRDPTGKVIQEIKYKLAKNKTVEEGAIYEKPAGKKWGWNIENAEKKETKQKQNPLLPSGEGGRRPDEGETENKEGTNFNVSNQEIQANLGKYTPNPSWQRKQNYRIILASSSIDGKIKIPENILTSQPRVLGAEKIKTEDNYYAFTPIVQEKHWAIKMTDNFWMKINLFLNQLLLKI